MDFSTGKASEPHHSTQGDAAAAAAAPAPEPAVTAPESQQANYFTFVVDSTQSMGDAVDACKRTIILIGGMLDMMGIKFEVVFYGDYDNDNFGLINTETRRSGKNFAVEVIHNDRLSIMNQLLNNYRVNNNGAGGDLAEACASAGHVVHQRIKKRIEDRSAVGMPPFKEYIFWMTDAPPHGVGDLVEHIYDSGRWHKVESSVDRSSAQYEKRVLSSMGLSTDFMSVMELLTNAGASVNMISTWSRPEDYHLQPTSLLYIPKRSEEQLRRSYDHTYPARHRHFRYNYVEPPRFEDFCRHREIEDHLTTDDTMIGLLTMMNILLIGGQFTVGFEYPRGFVVPDGLQITGDNDFDFPVENLRTYYDKFVTQVKKYPNMIRYAPFLAKPYFNAIRKLKLTGEHGELCKELKRDGIAQNVIDWFKEQGSSKLYLGDVNNEYLRKPDLPYSDFALVKSSAISFKDFLGIITYVQWRQGPECIKRLQECLGHFKVMHLDSDEFISLNGDYILMSAIAEQPSLLCSFITYQGTDGTMKEFTSLNTIVVAAVLQWCGESAPQLVEIMKSFIKRSSFMTWTRKKVNVPDSVFNLPTLTFIRQALSAHETTADKNVLDRIMRVLRIQQTLQHSIPNLETEINQQSMRPNELAKNAPHVYQAVCLIIGKPFPVNIFIKINKREFNEIRQNMENFLDKYEDRDLFRTNKMFKKFGNRKLWTSYMNKVDKLRNRLGGCILVSTYAYYFGQTCNTGLDYMTRDGQMDPFYWEKRIEKGTFNHRYNPNDFDSIYAYYEKHIGIDQTGYDDQDVGHGHRLISRDNMVPVENIEPGGCVAVSCTKNSRVRKGFCGSIYFVTDSTSGAVRSQSACARCRNRCDTYITKCGDCGTGIAMGTYIRTVKELDERGPKKLGADVDASHHFGKEDCTFCQIRGNSRMYDNVPMAQLIKNNLELFVSYFGVPYDVLYKLVSTGKASKALREKRQNANNEEIVDDVFVDLIFQADSWSKTKKDLQGLHHEGRITADGIATIQELISSNFKLDCIICGDTVRTVDTTVCHECGFCFCNGCAHGMYSDQAWYNQKQNAGNYSCPACRTPVRKGYARKFHYWILYMAIVNGDIQKALTTPKHEMITCGNPHCASGHRTSVIELGQCGAADGDDAEAAAADDDAPDYLECLHCKTQRIEEKNTELRRLRALEDTPGVTLPNGLIITQDGLVLRACPACGLIGARNGACWNQHCICGTNYPWCCGKLNYGEGVYDHLRRCVGNIYGTGHREGTRHNPDLHIPAADLNRLDRTQRAAVDEALSRGGNLAGPNDIVRGHNYDGYDDDDGEENGYDGYDGY